VVRVPKGAAITRGETIMVLSRLNEAKEYGWSDLTIAYGDHVNREEISHHQGSRVGGEAG
jgi:hypothetical protein